ncbi:MULTISPECIES: MtrB/PioB family outer membrane beta-barrel protein [Kordiimonas]|jgi:hypothetical protein|uniref:MtrB/PioB family outer membrane beta-barrel protein n=1 Tax=Kordiimonas TaxID=288021 RepID=UPI0025797B48|nr:MtrB/PioB family outer membrane beta-barrel protein [Kordiimonas sp. UBA4487]
MRGHVTKFASPIVGMVFVAVLGPCSGAVAQILPPGSKQQGNSDSHATAPWWAPHPDGLSFINPSPRTPSGFLYGMPRNWSPQTRTGDQGWQWHGFIEAGARITSGTTDAQGFREYADRSQGPSISRAVISGQNRSTGQFFNLVAGSPHRDDGYVTASMGRTGHYEVTGFFQSLRHVFATNAKPVWDGVGTGHLRLPNDLMPGIASRDQLLGVLGETSPTRLSLKREKGGLVARLSLTKQLAAEASVQHEWRKGSCPFGTGFAFPAFGQTLETVEPIDYQTTDFRLALDYTGQTVAARLQYHGSLFRNANTALTVENPGLSPFLPNFTAPIARQALPPDNRYHMISADLSAPLSFWNGRLTVAAHYSIVRQDDDLLPPTISEGILPLPGGLLDLSLWNTTGALSQTTAAAKRDRLTLNSKLLLVPARRLRVTLALKVQDESNDTNYMAFNPLTGQHGYIALDGGLGGVMPRLSGLYTPDSPGSRVRFRNMPFTKDRLKIAAQADYRFTHKTKLTMKASYVEETRRPREVETTRDTVLSLGVSTRAVRFATARLSYRYTNRSGTPYISNPYEAFYTSSLDGYLPLYDDGDSPHTLSSFRKFDLAAHHLHVLKGQVNFILAPTVDFAVSATLSRQDYRADFGLRDSKSSKLNAELTWQSGPRTSLYAFASYDSASRNVASIRDVGPNSTDGTAGGTNYPLANAWSATQGEKGWAFGGGYQRHMDDWTLDLTYMFSRNRSRLDYGYASTGAFDGRVSVEVAGTGLPDQTFLMHHLNARLGYRISDHMRLNLRYRLEHEALDDYHYSGFTSPLVGNDIYLGIQPANFTAHLIGLYVAIGY